MTHIRLGTFLHSLIHLNRFVRLSHHRSALIPSLTFFPTEFAITKFAQPRNARIAACGKCPKIAVPSRYTRWKPLFALKPVPKWRFEVNELGNESTCKLQLPLAL